MSCCPESRQRDSGFGNKSCSCGHPGFGGLFIFSVLFLSQANV